MNYSIESNTTRNDVSNVFIYIIVLMAIFLNQSNKIIGINISFSDFFCLLALMFLFFKNHFKLLYIPTLFFLVVVIYTLFTSFFFVPGKFFYYPLISTVMVNYIKLLVIFLYFVLGYNISLLRQEHIVLRWYSVLALLIGSIGVLFTVFNIKLLSSILFYGGVRYMGFMIDPNYFSIIQTSAFVYHSRNMDMKGVKRSVFLFILILSILASGSKTGLITLLCYVSFRIVESTFKIKINALISKLLLFVVYVITIAYIPSIIQSSIQYFYSFFPTFNRIQLIFIDFNRAISGMGSGRDSTWSVAVNLINLSPIFGIGVGTYSGIASELYNTSAIAHNTYLQLFSEWGIVLATLLFSYILYIVGKATFYKGENLEINIILRDILIVFLIGSLGISLNNARMFWLFFGMLVANINRVY